MDDSKKKISFIINPISGTQGKEQISENGLMKSWIKAGIYRK